MINEKRLLDTFLEYVQIDSETKNEKAMGERLVQDLKALGFEVQTDRAGEAFGSNGFNVHAFLEGTIPGDPTIFCAHMDTVAPGNGIRPVIKDGIIGTDGSTILAGDDKSGIAAIMEALAVIKEKDLPHRSADILFTIGEEGGMNGAKNMDYSMLKGKGGHGFRCGRRYGKGPDLRTWPDQDKCHDHRDRSAMRAWLRKPGSAPSRRLQRGSRK